jgi:DNA-binding LacI/PurR family transcriptional regulator
VVQPLEELGRYGARSIVNALANPAQPPELTVLPTELVVRASSTGPKP